MSDPAVFLDRDGTIIEDVGYLGDPERMQMFDFSAEAIHALNEAGMRVFICTNQSGIARGMFGVGELEAIHMKMLAMLAMGGAKIEGIYYCPHGPDEGCRCRKPEAGLLEQAAREHDVDLSRSFMVGDTAADLGAAKAAGAKSILVLTGKGKDTKPDKADHVAKDLLDAVRWIENQ